VIAQAFDPFFTTKPIGQGTLTLTDLRLGRQRFDIRFWRDGNETVFKVLKGTSDAVERMSIALSGSMTGS